MKLNDLKFECRVVDKTTGLTVAWDYTYITPIDEFGSSESVDIHVGCVLRNVKKELAK